MEVLARRAASELKWGGESFCEGDEEGDDSAAPTCVHPWAGRVGRGLPVGARELPSSGLLGKPLCCTLQPPLHSQFYLEIVFHVRHKLDTPLCNLNRKTLKSKSQGFKYNGKIQSHKTALLKPNPAFTSENTKTRQPSFRREKHSFNTIIKFHTRKK